MTRVVMVITACFVAWVAVVVGAVPASANASSSPATLHAVLTTASPDATGCYSPIGCSDRTSVQPGTRLTLYFVAWSDADHDDGAAARPTGRVSFADNNIDAGSALLDDHLASVRTSPLIAGRHTFTATYAGDANYLPTRTAPLTVDVEAAPPHGRAAGRPRGRAPGTVDRATRPAGGCDDTRRDDGVDHDHARDTRAGTASRDDEGRRHAGHSVIVGSRHAGSGGSTIAAAPADRAGAVGDFAPDSGCDGRDSCGGARYSSLTFSRSTFCGDVASSSSAAMNLANVLSKSAGLRARLAGLA